MMHLIVGRSGTGKDTLRASLEGCGLKAVISRTTRPPRSTSEDTHVFLTEKEADELWPDAVATTTIGPYRYFATRDDVLSADIYIIDPNGVHELTQSMPDVAFDIVYLMSDKNSRRIMASRRADDPQAERLVFDARDKAEDEMFSKFERLIESAFDTTDKGVLREASFGLPSNVTHISQYTNDYVPSTIEDITKKILAVHQLHDQTAKLARCAIGLGILDMDLEGNVLSQDQEGNDTSTPFDIAVEMLTSDAKLYGLVTQEVLKTSTFDEIADA